jgi:prepilin signal peptidase PulO-like enzyme (type II secretory pathway)
MTAALDAIVAVIFVGVLVAISALDLRERTVPSKIVLPAAAVVLAARTIAHPSIVWLLGGLGAAAFLLVATRVQPGATGMGDVKLALLLGFAVGRTVPLALAAALLAGFVPSMALVVRQGAQGRTLGVPFAPCLALGGVFALLIGPGL